MKIFEIKNFYSRKPFYELEEKLPNLRGQMFAIRNFVITQGP